MTVPPAPHHPPSGRTGTRIVALMLAVLFLAVIGGSAGYILGLRHNRQVDRTKRRADNQSSATGSPTPTTRDPGGAKGGGSQAKKCLTETERDAKGRFGSPGGLVQVLYVRSDKSEVWICRDADGNVFYQGHLRSAAEQQGSPRPPLNEGVNSILLKSPRPDGDGWVAENNTGGSTTTYRASPEEVVVEQPNKAPDHQPVVAHEP